MKSKPRSNKIFCSKPSTRPRAQLAPRGRSQSGASLIELGIITPLLLLLALGAIDFGRAYYLSIEVTNAARAGVQYGLKTQRISQVCRTQRCWMLPMFQV